MQTKIFTIFLVLKTKRNNNENKHNFAKVIINSYRFCGIEELSIGVKLLTNKKHKVMGKKWLIMASFLAFVNCVFVACNNTEENEEMVKKNSLEVVSTTGTFEYEFDNNLYEFYVVNGKLVNVTNTNNGGVYKTKQVVYVDGIYSNSEEGIAAASKRVDELRNNFNIPCADYYLVYNKEKQTNEILVMYTTDRPCDWMNDILN